MPHYKLVDSPSGINLATVEDPKEDAPRRAPAPAPVAQAAALDPAPGDPGLAPPPAMSASPMRCAACGFSASSPQGLAAHVRAKHP